VTKSLLMGLEPHWYVGGAFESWDEVMASTIPRDWKYDVILDFMTLSFAPSPTMICSPSASQVWRSGQRLFQNAVCGCVALLIVTSLLSHEVPPMLLCLREVAIFQAAWVVSRDNVEHLVIAAMVNCPADSIKS